MHSMTACGQGASSEESGDISVVIQSVNRRHFEVSILADPPFLRWDAEMRHLLREQASRGAIQVRISLQRSSTQHQHEFLQQAAWWESLQNQLSSSWQGPLSLLLLKPETNLTSSVEDLPSSDLFWNAFHRALSQWILARQEEGSRLKTALKASCDRCLECLKILSQWTAEMGRVVKTQWEATLNESSFLSIEDKIRLQTEATHWIHKADAEEEMLRLHSHLTHLLRLLESQEPSGKSLEFYVQELQREAGTLTVKLGQIRWRTAEPINMAIALKTEIERIREQVQNVE